LQGREFVVTSVFVTMARNTAGAGDRGSTARFGLVMHLADLLPSLTINLRDRSLTSCALDAASASNSLCASVLDVKTSS
jgi:hypothetical protein